MEVDFFFVFFIFYCLVSEGNEIEFIDVINNGIDINEEDDNGLIVFYYVVEGGYVKCVEILL